jgi:transcriptional regulator with XRE-family HTH domain
MMASRAPAKKTPKAPKTPSLLLWRERMGYSQTEASRQLGCSKVALIGWELGRKKTPRYIHLAMAALALGIAPNGNGEK